MTNALFISLWMIVAQTASPSPNDPAAGKDSAGKPADTKPASGETLPAGDPLNYTYNPFGKRDPFRPFLLDHLEAEGKSANPLLNYDLSKFNLTGVLSGVANPRAIVVDGDGHGHIITKGTRIGRNKGQVTNIYRDRIIVSEEFRDPLGKLIVSEFTMKLHLKGSK